MSFDRRTGVIAAFFAIVITIISCEKNPIDAEPAAIPVEISDLRVDSTIGGTAFLSWTAPGGPGTTDSTSYYCPDHTTDTSGWSTTLYCTGPGPAPGGQHESMQVPGLLPDSTYYFRVSYSYLTDFGTETVYSNTAVGSPFPDFVVAFPDTVLDSLVKNALGIEYDTVVYYSQLQRMDTFIISYKNESKVRDLAGLSFAHQLKLLSIIDQQIDDFTELSTLTNLENLTLEYCGITDVSFLSDLIFLKELWMRENDISDVTALSGLVRLERLLLGFNQISDISGLSNLHLLWSLRLQSNRISDLSSLPVGIHLYNLWLQDNPITDISPLSSQEHLRTLYLTGTYITSLEPLADISTLEDLFIYDLSVGGFGSLSGLQNLWILGLPNCRIQDIGFLTNLTGLEVLDLSQNLITDIGLLSSLDSLRTLRLSHNRIGDLQPLVENAGIGQDDEVYLENNDPPFTSGNADIQALVARGVSVVY